MINTASTTASACQDSLTQQIQAKSYLDLLASAVFRLRGDLISIAEKAASQDENAPIEWSRLQCYIRALSRIRRPWHPVA